MHTMLKLRLSLFTLAMIVGCRGPQPDELTWNDAATATTKAIATYDKDGDAQLSVEELKACPAFSDNLRRLDSNRDRKLSADEIRARFDEHAKLKRFIGLETTVTSRGKVPVGTVVTLTPEPFMGDHFPTYAGTVNDEGYCPLVSQGAKVFGVPVGFYTLKAVNAGKETIRGVEIAIDTTGSRLEIAL